MLAIQTQDFYERILSELSRRGLRYAVGGTYSLSFHTRIERKTKDLDLFVKHEDMRAILNALSEVGYRTELTHPHWLGKAYEGDQWVDIIYSSGNGVARVDEEFFAHAQEGVLFGRPVLFCPAEEMIWIKSFVMERERYEGADVAHLLHACSGRIDFQRLLNRFGENFRVLLSHLMLFGFIYPSDKDLIPRWLIHQLIARFLSETAQRQQSEPVCGGTLLSREQFLPDVQDWGYIDARLAAGAMNENEIAAWTKAAVEAARLRKGV